MPFNLCMGAYVPGFRVPCGTVPRSLFWDTEDPYHYVRLQSLPADTATELSGESLGEDLLIVGGEDHKTGQANDAEERYARLEAWTRERFPMAGTRCCQWSGQVLETMDGLASINRNPLDGPNIFIATGDSGQGMTHGTIAGRLLTDLIMEREHPWASLYDPARKTLGGAERFVKENVNVALQYGAWVTGGDVCSTDDIVAATGAVVRRGLTKVAAYRDKAGTLNECVDAPVPIEIRRVRMLVCPGADTSDSAALTMLRQSLDSMQWDIEQTAVETLTSELAARIALDPPAILYIAALPPRGLAHARYLCKRLRDSSPELQIVVGRWGQKCNCKLEREQLEQAGATFVTTSLAETIQLLKSRPPLLNREPVSSTIPATSRPLPALVSAGH